MKHALSQKIIAQLGMVPRQLRLLSAVHEAGHAITAHTLNMRVTSAAVTSFEKIGVGGDCIALDFSVYPQRMIPAPDVLAMKISGFQASHMWLEGRGIDGNTLPYSEVLNTLSGGDLNWCSEFSSQRGHPPLQQHAVAGAALVLSCRWMEVLALAYALARQGFMSQSELQPYLEAGPDRAERARREYGEWSCGFESEVARSNGS